MARMRYVKPDFWTDEKIVDLGPWERLCFIGLWNFADDHGYIAYRPKKLKMQIFPADSVDVSRILMSLREASLVDLYDSDRGQVLRIRNWDKHQYIQHPGKSDYADLDMTFVPVEPRNHADLAPDDADDDVNPHEASRGFLLDREGDRDREGEGVLTFRTDASPGAIARIETIKIVNWWLDLAGSEHRPPSSIRDSATAQIRALVADGIPERQIQDGLREWWAGRYPPSTIPNYVARAGQPKMATGTSRALQTLQIDVSGIEP